MISRPTSAFGKSEWPVLLAPKGRAQFVDDVISEHKIVLNQH